jgi:4-amino-4-deoxy-L-arabinose transferase-like glycosyltransferase
MNEINNAFLTKRDQLPERQIPLWVEITALLIPLGLALFLRLWNLGDIPPGLHFDEAIDLKIGLDVANGARPMYVTEGWGREGLYYYLVALVLQFVPYNPDALRVSAVICGIGVLVTAYFLGRIWHSRLTAWFTVTWLSFTFWPLSASRFGVRNISLAFMLGLVVWVLWRTWRSRKYLWQHFAIAGLLMGLTMYTYQPARFTPFIFMAFALYLVLFHRDSHWSNGRLWLIWLATFMMITLPLIIILNLNGSIETEQRAFTIEPITQLLDGNAQPILTNTLATLKVFTIRGDPLKSYNVPDRPIFVPSWTGLFFYIGLVLALRRWKQPVFAFVLLWLFFTLLPTVITISAPNFNRMVAAQVPIMFLAAFPMAELIHWVEAHQKKWGIVLALFLIGVAFSSVAIATWHDYFDVWPNVYAKVHTLNREISAVANYLEHNPDRRPAVISSRDIADEDPYIVSVSMDREEFAVRWVDTSQAIAIPVGVNEARLIVTNDRWIDNTLLILSGISSEPIYHEPEFTVFLLRNGDWAVADKTPLLYLAPDVTIPTGETAKRLNWPYPYEFCDCLLNETGDGNLMLTGFSVGEISHLGENLEVITTWQPLEDSNFVSLAMFVHLLNDAGEIMAQYDGLGYPPHTWRIGDRFVQIARLPLSVDLLSGEYWLQLGLYERETGERWFLLNSNDIPVADRVLIGPLLLDGEGALHLEQKIEIESPVNAQDSDKP